MTALYGEPSWSTCPVLGVNCFSGSLSEAAEIVVDRARSGVGGYVCAANAHVLVAAKHDSNLRDALAEACFVFPDGAPVAWLQRRLGATRAERVAGPDLMPLAIEKGQASGMRHFFLGAGEDVLSQLSQTVDGLFPASTVVGSYSPSRDEIQGDSSRLLHKVQSARPQIVWCAFGAPLQELWMSRNAEALAPAVVLGVGAAFDFLAGTKRRAPAWMQRSGLEWLFRLIHEPRRLASRYLRTNTEFLFRALNELLAGSRS